MTAPYEGVPGDDDSGGAGGSGAGGSPTEFVQAFGRGLAVIAAFDAENPRMTLSDAARRAGVTRAAARRLLHTLVQLGYVRAEDRYFTLTPKILELGYSYLSALGLPEIGLPYLTQVAETVKESAYMTVLDGKETVCVAAVPMRRIWNASITVGTRLPAYATAAGRAILAFEDEATVDEFLASAELKQVTPFTTTDPEALREALAKARKQGYSVVDDELEEGLRTVAVPILGESGVLASLSVSTLARPAATAGARKKMAPALQEARAEIEADLRNLRDSVISS
ncbi:MAG TPA: IclR family transcriptional regulator C-terminal domain-containing protein [Solirubrobacterales bacterium]